MKSTKLFLILLLATQFVFSSCSSKSSKKSENPTVESEFAVDDDVPMSEGEEGVVALDEGLYDSIEDDIKDEAQVAPDNIYDDEEAVQAYNKESKEDIYKVFSDNFATYKVEEGETLMWIAYKLYGDYREWKKLKLWNENLLDYEDRPETGATLKYQPLETAFNWKSQGNPYLVLRGDTLFKISRKVYEGEGDLWRSLWVNNQVQIRDPDLIFAGFTLFYLPYNEAKRSLASDGEG